MELRGNFPNHKKISKDPIHCLNTLLIPNIIMKNGLLLIKKTIFEIKPLIPKWLPLEKTAYFQKYVVLQRVSCFFQKCLAFQNQRIYKFSRRILISIYVGLLF